MGNIVLLLVVALVFGAVVFGVMTLVTGGDPGLTPAEPDSRARPLPADRPLIEGDVSNVTFDVTWRGYRMAQVDQTLRRLAYDLGYKTELIQVLEAEVLALREGRLEDADTLAHARVSALAQKEAAAAEAAGLDPAPATVDLTADAERVTADSADDGARDGDLAEPGAAQHRTAVVGTTADDPAEAPAGAEPAPASLNDVAGPEVDVATAEPLDAEAAQAQAADADADSQDSDRAVTATRAGRGAAR
jgi:DivIVA domain-containing protein